MDGVQILFWLVSLLAVISAFMVVTTRILIRAALWLILALFGVAVLFVLLEAGFMAVIQVVIYIGAISILFIFVAMLTRRVMEDTGPQTNTNWPVAAIAAAGLFAVLFWVINGWTGAAASAPAFPTAEDPVAALGAALVNPSGYVIPFEIASVLLLAALIGAIVVAWDRHSKPAN